MLYLVSLLFCLLGITSIACAQESDQITPQFTLLDHLQYQQTINYSRKKVDALLNALNPLRHQSLNTQIAFLAIQLTDTPYIYTGAMGEGDWQPHATHYQPGAIHLKQDPVYRLDAFDCQTFVQVVIALLHSSVLSQFDQNILKTAYGAAGNPSGEIVRYDNRNHFIDGDWNPINEKNGWISDMTSHGEFAPYVKLASANITRKKWFLSQQKNLSGTIRVLNHANGLAMIKRVALEYSSLHDPKFNLETVKITYIPKALLAIAQPNGDYHPNQTLLDKIATPAVVEMVYDVKNWNIDGKNIKDIIGTELNVAHLGLLYRQTFKRGELIYHKISCDSDQQAQKTCQVTPIQCLRNQCNELMFVHATDAYPRGFYWYQTPDGHYTCTQNPPTRQIRYTTCNRVEREPFFEYLTDYQYQTYSNMNNAALVGIHIEQLMLIHS